MKAFELSGYEDEEFLAEVTSASINHDSLAVLFSPVAKLPSDGYVSKSNQTEEFILQDEIQSTTKFTKCTVRVPMTKRQQSYHNSRQRSSHPSPLQRNVVSMDILPLINTRSVTRKKSIPKTPSVEVDTNTVQVHLDLHLIHCALEMVLKDRQWNSHHFW